VLVHIRFGNPKENVLALLDRDLGNVRHGLQPELQNSLAALLLAAGLLASWFDLIWGVG
jgi:hypothetical protein